ncbi:MAG: M28 family peptidase, partial [Anaerolineales bacterium]
MVLTIALMAPPTPLPADAPAADFSAGRAMQDLAVIALEPHPMGVSRAHADVRDFLLGEIHSLGLEPHVQDTFGLRVIHANWVIGGAVENIFVRLPGTDPDGAILLMAHYDSAPAVPGAADNGSGVVTILEILRALRARPPLRHDVIFFFTDGEEPGTIGAHAFVDQHPWFDEVKLAINLDTITTAPPALIRTNAGDGSWIQALADVAAQPAFISLPYHLFPAGDTDLVPFSREGLPGADFNAMKGYPEMHTVLDLPEVVDPASVQHAGDQLLALVQDLGSASTLELHVADQTFFPLLGKLVHYPAGWAVPLASVASLCFLGVLAYGFRTRKLTWAGLGLGVVTFLLSIGFSVVLANLLWSGIQALHPEYGYSELHPHLSDDLLYALGFIALSLAVFVFSIALARKKASDLDLTAGALIIWLPAAVATAILVAATSYLATWSLLAGTLALLLALIVQPREDARSWSGIGFLFSGILAIFLWMPVAYSSYLGSSFPMLNLMVGLVGLWLGNLIPILDWITAPKRWILPVAALLVTVGFFLAGHFLVGQNSPPALVNPMGYWLDADQGEAHWIAFVDDLDRRQNDLLVDPLQRSYTEIFPEAPPYAVQTSSAPILDLGGPQLEVLEDTWKGDHRLIRLHFTTSMHDRLYVIIPEGASVLAFILPHNERTEMPPSDQGFVLRFDGMPVEGFEMAFELDASGVFQILLVEERTGLPSFVGLLTQPLPGTMRTPGEFYQGIPTDFTAIHRAFTIQET